MKRPSFQFYPADWRKDPALSSCSLAARGLWIELLCVAHESDDYGHLTVNGNAMNDVQIARSVGESLPVVRRLLAELERAGVFSRDGMGAVFSRRMERDERIRITRAECGKLGGNPTLLNQKHIQEDNQTVKQKPTPSVSSSSSSSELQERDASSPLASPPAALDGHGEKPSNSHDSAKRLGQRLPDDWRLPDEWRDWATSVYPDIDAQRAVRISLKFRDHWIGKPGKDGRKADWQATWRNWVRREVGDA